MEKGKEIILKYIKSFYLPKGYPASETILPKPSLACEKENYPTPDVSNFSVSSKKEREKSCKTLVKVTCWRHRHTKRFEIMRLWN